MSDAFWMAFFAFLTSFAAALLSWVGNREVRRVHQVVNSERDAMKKHIAALEHAATLVAERAAVLAEADRVRKAQSGEVS